MKPNKQSGQVSSTLIILAVVVLIMIVAVYFIIKLAAGRSATVAKKTTTTQTQTVTEPPKPVYDTTVGNIRFLLDSSVNLGSVVKAPNQYQQDLKTTDKFIKVAVRAQNKGKTNTTASAWSIGNIVDSEGRNFTVYNNAYYFLPQPNLCGAILKPEFAPTPCYKIYEVSKASTHLKIEVSAAVPGSSKRQEAFLDLRLP